MKHLFIILICLLALVIKTNGQQPPKEIPAPPQSHPIALVGGTIHTVSGSVIERGTILFEKGKITAIGSNVTLPPQTEIIDVSTKNIYPGLIDACTNLGLVEIGAVRATRDLQETGTINPNIRAEVALNPESELIPVARANGITLALIMPQGGIISGTAAVIELDGWTWEEMTMKAPAGMVVNWPSMTITRGWWERRSEEEQIKDRDKAINELRNAFHNARAYMNAKRSEQQSGITRHNTDLRWEAMIPVLEKKIPVLMHANDVQQIQAAVAWAEQENVNIVIIGGHDSWLATEILKRNNIPVIVTPIHRLPSRRWESYDSPFTLPKKLLDAGIRFCIAGHANGSNSRNLPYHAATAAAYGLPKDEALKAITLYAAQILGIDDRVGSLEVGKDATLIITNGDPLEITTNVEMEFIQGKKIQLTSRHTRLYEKYKEKYRRLQEK